MNFSKQIVKHHLSILQENVKNKIFPDKLFKK